MAASSESTPLKEEEDSTMTTLKGVAYDLFMTTRLNILLVFVPLAFAAKLFVDGTLGKIPDSEARPGSAITFICCLVALCPLAERLGYVTEKLADNIKSQMVAGLINTTCGNIPELVV